MVHHYTIIRHITFYILLFILIFVNNNCKKIRGICNIPAQNLPFFSIISIGDGILDFLFLVSTALSVSLDSFLCGLSLYVPPKHKNKAICIICLTIFTLCFIGAFLGLKLGSIFYKYSNVLGGFLLIIVALFEAMENEESERFITFKQKGVLDYFLIGFAVGMDGLLGSLTLSLMFFNPLLVTLIITFLHVILLYVSISISTEFLLKYSFIKRIAPTFIFILGVIKVLC